MRIRSIRPEFWSSEDIAAMDWHSRLVYIGLWSYVDDNGVGRDLERLIVTDLFPLDEDLSESSLRVHVALKHLEAAGNITRYTVDGKPYLHVTAWDTHQKINRPTAGRYPLPTSSDAEIHDPLTEPSVRPHAKAPLGEGEKGRRGEGEKPSSSEVATAPIRPEIEALCTLLADLIEHNGSKRPAITQKWRDAVRLMLDRDGRTTEQIAYLVNWSQADEFWRSNIQSMPKLREKFDQLRLKAQQPDRTQRRGVGLQSSMEGLAFFQPQENQ